jgi:hypothetical protein
MGKMKSELYTDTRIYYGGDMANSEGFGTITAIEKNKWGIHVNIELDDGRKMTVSRSQFSDKYLGHGGTRFVTEKAYNNYYQLQFNKFYKLSAKEKENECLYHLGNNNG